MTERISDFTQRAERKKARISYLGNIPLISIPREMSYEMRDSVYQRILESNDTMRFSGRLLVVGTIGTIYFSEVVGMNRDLALMLNLGPFMLSASSAIVVDGIRNVGRLLRRRPQSKNSEKEENLS